MVGTYLRVGTPGLRGWGIDKLQEESGRVVGAYLLPAHPTLFPAYFTIAHPTYILSLPSPNGPGGLRTDRVHSR